MEKDSQERLRELDSLKGEIRTNYIFYNEYQALGVEALGDLMGLSAEKATFDTPDHPELSGESLAQNVKEFLYDHDETEWSWAIENDHPDYFGAQRILGKIATQRSVARKMAPTIYRTVGDLPDPVRTVAVNHFYVGHDEEVIAKGLGMSVETVSFLVDIALHVLAQHVRFAE